MCFSVEVEKDLKKLAQRFDAELLIQDESWYEDNKKRAEDRDLVKRALNLARKPSSNIFREPGADQRIFPGYFTNVIMEENGKRVFKKMRYRVRPSYAKSEIPTKYNVFNARIDALETRDTWKNLFMNQHALLPFKRFYEWVEYNGQKRLVTFAPQDRSLMWAPCLYDYWENKKEGIGFYSFAIITDDPPPEVSEMGHDRCPIFMEERFISEWLNPKISTKEKIYKDLAKKEPVYYLNQWVA